MAYYYDKHRGRWYTRTGKPVVSASEFSGYQKESLEFATGSVRGVRTWLVDSLGRLTGINYKKVWLPGENEAICLKRNDPYGFGALTVSLGSINFGSAPTAAELNKAADEEKAKHSMPACGCGFYAYYDGSNDYEGSGHVSGIIEGWGETLIGTRGFRVSKARIVALHIHGDRHEEGGERPLSRVQAHRVIHNYGNVPFFDDYNHMIDEFPPDGGFKPLTPEDDPEFWTRWPDHGSTW